MALGNEIENRHDQKSNKRARRWRCGRPLEDLQQRDVMGMREIARIINVK